MAKAMTKSQVTEHLAGKVGITKKAAGEFLDHLAALAHKEAKNSQELLKALQDGLDPASQAFVDQLRKIEQTIDRFKSERDPLKIIQRLQDT